MIKNDSQAPSCTCPSGDGSLVHPCPAHPAVDQADVAAKLTFINGRPAMCGCQVEYSDGGGEYSDVIYVTLCAKHSGSAILDLVATNRIALTPEYEGQWHADLYLDREIPLAKVEGATPAEAVLALMSAERIDPEQESVEQASGDERAAFEAWATHLPMDRQPLRPDLYMPQTQWAWEAWQFRAALARVAELEKQVAVAWGAFHFGGERDGKLYTHCETEAQIDAYILDMHRSSDSLTLRKSPLYAAPFAQNQPTVPDGYALIPVRETEAMHDAVMALLYKGVARTDTQKLLDAYIAAAPAQAQHSVPEGWKLVPVEPTEDVLEAIHNGGYVGDDQELRWFYQSILAAAPAPGGE
ncbi:hypothetical protein J2Y72_003566 [Pseudomonas aeruginosa]|uniref:hypothetical protein n=1 Tax=Pseudomonas aeruginosa TaxID=287 RepID=UPI0020A091AA|nr:hypothetical protein [Pseudomonas aeruginosa]MCP1569263.1 hypothetical protein [Pseudomonas aeruginosa]